MANSKSKSGLVGMALTGGHVELATIVPQSGNARTPQSGRLRFERVALPDFDPDFPQALPSASTLAALLKSALGRAGVGTGRVAIAVGGSRMALRYFIGSDAHVRGELNQAVERSINYLPFGLGDRLAEQHLHKLDDGRTHALLAVSAAETLDPLIKALEQIGMRVEIVEPALVALTRLASLTGRLDDTASLLVCANDDGIDISVIAAGQVLFNRRPMIAESDAGESDDRPCAVDLTRELERVSRHYARVFDASHEMVAR